MQNRNYRWFVLTLFAAVLAITSAVASAQTASLPTRLSDAEFWKFIEDSSEPNGSFSSNNFVSNETVSARNSSFGTAHKARVRVSGCWT